jgi:hypothetical protein
VNGVSLRRNEEIIMGEQKGEDTTLAPIANIYFKMQHCDVYQRLIP